MLKRQMENVVLCIQECILVMELETGVTPKWGRKTFWSDGNVFKQNFVVVMQLDTFTKNP